MVASMLKLSALLLSFLTTSAFATPSLVERAAGPDDVLAATALSNVYKILGGSLSDGSTHTECTNATLIVRKEYGDLTTDERDDYVKSVKCLMSSPSKLSATQYPGAKTRYDDFVVVHMNMTPSVHSTANFLHWHRYFVWSYERALRDECGYKGYQPYWNWGKYSDPNTSPIFNGDAHSMGGNGQAMTHGGGRLGGAMTQVPAGPGGGCVLTGPFANTTVNLGPLMSTEDAATIKIPANPRSDGFGYNPRCLRRDVNTYFTSRVLTPSNVATHLKSSTDLFTWQNSLQTDTTAAFCLHSAGHYTIWGDPGGDVFVSPGEPVFWLHHGQIDRHWWVWQNQDPANRVQQYKGGTNWMNPNSAPGHITDVQTLNVVTPKGSEAGYASSQLVSSTAGPFCYVYA